tara:strand:- start:595 stop:1185 length:591 start_codon:yes stop_codon:yes gene_type:complete
MKSFIQYLQEANVRSPQQIEELGRDLQDTAIGDYVMAHGDRPMGQDRENIIKDTSAAYAGRAAVRNWDNREVASKLGDFAQTGDVETVRSIGNVLAAQGDVRPGSLKVAGAENVGKPVSVADYRKFLNVAKGKYQVPWQQEPLPELDANNFDGADPNNTADAGEVETAQQENQMTGRFDTPSEMASKFFTQGRKTK